MKKYIFLLVVVLSFLGCEKEMMDYEGKDGVYFSVQEVPPSLYGDPEIWSHMDTTLIPFSLLLENDSTVRLKVRVMGDVVNYDRIGRRFVDYRVSERGLRSPGGTLRDYRRGT